MPFQVLLTLLDCRRETEGVAPRVGEDQAAVFEDLVALVEDDRVTVEVMAAPARGLSRWGDALAGREVRVPGRAL